MTRTPKLTPQRLAELAQAHGYSVQERTECRCYPTLARCYDETFLGVRDGEQTVAEFDVRFIEGWMSEETILWYIRKYVREDER